MKHGFNPETSVARRHLAYRISRENKIPYKSALTVIDRTFDAIIHALSSGKMARVQNFGTFVAVIRRPKVGRNPRHPEQLHPIPMRTLVKFIPGNKIRDAVNKLTPK